MITIGAQFAEERRRQDLTLEQVSVSTKIREEFLKAIEKGDFSSLPSGAYAYGFVRNYAKFLGLPVEKSLAIFRREFDEKKNVEVLPRGFTNPKEYSAKRMKIGRSVILGGFVALALLLYLIFQYRSAIFNPEIKIYAPLQNQVITSLTFEVKGKTDPNATVSVNNSQVSLDDNGNFTKEVSVFPGDSTIDIKAENRFGRISEVKRHILVKPGY